MSSYRAWRGAIEFAGFPVNIALYSRVRNGNGSGSFRQLSPDGNPVKQQLVDSQTGEIVERNTLQKGVEVPGAKGQYVALTPEALELIEAQGRTDLCEPTQFCPADTIDWTLATGSYAVRPDDKVPGSDQSVNIIWNGLHRSGLAYVTQMSMRAGSECILAIYADGNGLWAATLPFQASEYDVPDFEFTPNEKARTLFARVTEAGYSDLIGDYAPGAYASHAAERREAAVTMVLSGVEPERPEPTPVPQAPSLMDLMEAAAEGLKA